MPVTDGNSRFFEQLVGGGTKPIQTGTTMFDVMALDIPNGTAEPWSTPEREVKVGEIKTTTEFVVSLWGDEKLFFSHARLDHGFDLRPELDRRETPFFNRRNNRWDQDGFSSLINPDLVTD